MLQDYEQALVWIERAEAAAPEIVVMGFVRSVLLAMAGQEDEARATMQRYLANDKAPFRTMSQWRARQSENRCRPIVRVFLYGGKNSTMASEQPDCRSEQRGCPRRRGDRTSVFAACLLWVAGAENTAAPPRQRLKPLLPGRGRGRIVALSRVNAVFANDIR